MAHWEAHKFGGMSLATSKIYRTVGDLLISKSNVWDVQFEFDNNIEAEVDVNDGMTNIKRNASPSPTMSVVSSRGMI